MARRGGPVVVAELGRPETPEEEAARRAESRRQRRESQTTLNLVVALVVSLVVAGFFGILLSGGGESTRMAAVDYRSVAHDAQQSVDEHLVVPDLPSSWKANRAELDEGDGQITSWHIGFLTPRKDFIGVVQGISANPTWLSDQVEGARPSGSRVVEGVRFTEYDRSGEKDPGNVAFALATTSGGSDVVIFGTASQPEFAVVARAVARELAP